MSPRAQRERGITLLIATIAVIALALAGAALLRTVATATAIGGNLVARQQATLAASAAIEEAAAALFSPGIIDTTGDDAAHHYFAARQAGEDRRGIPAALRSLRDYPTGWTAIDVGDGLDARHVVERLCLLPGEASAANCTLSPPSVEAALGTPPPGEPPRVPQFRVTVRVDGPRGAATFVQTILAATLPDPRRSWRVLDE
jgi:hypothetical protein